MTTVATARLNGRPDTAKPKNTLTPARRRRDAKIIAALDSQGRWVDTDKKIRCQTFVANMRVLCDYVEAAAPRRAAE